VARVAVVGPGAIGVAYAAAAVEAGHEVTLHARRPRGPLVLEHADGREVRLGAPAVDPGSVGGAAEWVFLAVKAHQTAGAALWLRVLCGPGTTVVVLQNGVEHRALVEPLAGEATVLPTVVWTPAQADGDGRVRLQGDVRLVVPDSPAGRALGELLGGSPATVEPAADFVTEAWRKLVINAVGALQALSGRTAEVFRDEEVGELARRLAAECVAVARAEGASLGEDTPDAVLERRRNRPPARSNSILADRLAGRALEWDARNGVIRRLGARHGIPTPVSDVVVPLLIAASRT
jgi:2-dehydropantoate 2-reductase